MKPDKEKNMKIEDYKRLFEQTKQFVEENQEVLDRIDDWETILGMTIDEMEAYEIGEIVEMVKEKLGIGKPELVNAIRPKKYVMPNNKLANELPSGKMDFEGALMELVVNRKKEVITKVTLNYDDENIQIFDKGKRFTPYDRTVLNAVCSIYESGGNVNFTPDQVYRAMNGLDDKQAVSPQTKGAITKSLDKMRRIMSTVDFTDEAKAHKKNVERTVIEDYLLPAKKIELRAGGHEVTGYKLHAKPILYEYAQATNQVITVPSKLLNTKDVINTTPEVIVIREYLIRRIEVMKRNPKTQTNKIELVNIYEEINEPEPTKRKTQKIRETLEKLLTKFKDEKYIINFKFYKKGRAIYGIEIIF